MQIENLNPDKQVQRKEPKQLSKLAKFHYIFDKLYQVSLPQSAVVRLLPGLKWVHQISCHASTVSRTLSPDLVLESRIKVQSGAIFLFVQ